jgi:putative tricarboxylic transport membrane protein
LVNQDPDNTGVGEERKKTSVSSLIHWTDFRLTMVILAVCGVLYAVTTGFEEVAALLAQNIPPEWFPQLLIWTIVVLSMVLPFEHLFLEKGAAEIDKDRSEKIKPMAMITAVLLVLAVTSILLFGTALAMVLVCIALPLLWGERRAKLLVPYFILFPLAVTLLFTQVLKVYFEPGAFGPEIH